jgi:hypothetical protein
MAGTWAIRFAAGLAFLVRTGFRLALLVAALFLFDLAFDTDLLPTLHDYIPSPAPLAQILRAPELLSAVCAAMAVAASIVLGSIQVYQSNKVARATKTVDVIMHAAVRYNELNNNRPAPASVDEPPDVRGRKIHTWHNTYWGLKNDQFDYWLMGFFDHDTFCDWSSSIYKYFWTNVDDIDLDGHPDLLLGKIDYAKVKDSYSDSWVRYRNGVNGAVNPRFVAFVDALAHNVKFYSRLLAGRKKAELSGNEMEKIWNLLFTELIGFVYLEYIDKPGPLTRAWQAYHGFEDMILGRIGVHDLFSPLIRPGFGDRWRRDTIKGMNWQRYTQTLREDPKLRKPVFRSLMVGRRNEAEIIEELFGKPAALPPTQNKKTA